MDPNKSVIYIIYHQGRESTNMNYAWDDKFWKQVLIAEVNQNVSPYFNESWDD